MKKQQRDNYAPFVALTWATIDSAAWKTLSPAACWLFIHIKRQYTTKGGARRLILPFGHVAYKFTWPTFKKLRAELVRAGFIDIIQPGGLRRQAAIYGESSRWQDVSAALLRDADAGHIELRWIGTRLSSEWTPNKQQSESQRNIAAFNLRRKRPRKLRPTKSSVIRASRKMGNR